MHEDGLVINMGDDHDLRRLKQMVRDHFDLQNIYFDGNQLSDTKPEMSEKLSAEDESGTSQPETPPATKSPTHKKADKPRGHQLKPRPHHKKNKHSKRKGMHHKRTEK